MKLCPKCRRPVNWENYDASLRFVNCKFCGAVLVTEEGKRHLAWCEELKRKYKDAHKTEMGEE